MIKFFIPYRLPGLNEIIAMSKRHWGIYAGQKKDHTLNVARIIGKHKPMPRVFINFWWVEPDRRRDPDNISAGGRKIIIDGMVKSGLLENDGWAQIDGWTDSFKVDKDNPGVVVEVTEV